MASRIQRGGREGEVAPAEANPPSLLAKNKSWRSPDRGVPRHAGDGDAAPGSRLWSTRCIRVSRKTRHHREHTAKRPGDITPCPDSGHCSRPIKAKQANSDTGGAGKAILHKDSDRSVRGFPRRVDASSLGARRPWNAMRPITCALWRASQVSADLPSVGSRRNLPLTGLRRGIREPQRDCPPTVGVRRRCREAARFPPRPDQPSPGWDRSPARDRPTCRPDRP